MNHSPAGEGAALLKVEQNREENEISGTTNEPRDNSLAFAGSYVPPGAEVNNPNQSTEV